MCDSVMCEGVCVSVCGEGRVCWVRVWGEVCTCVCVCVCDMGT